MQGSETENHNIISQIQNRISRSNKQNRIRARYKKGSSPKSRETENTDIQVQKYIIQNPIQKTEEW